MTNPSTRHFSTRHGYIEKRSRSAPFLLLFGVGVLVTAAGLAGVHYGEVWRPRGISAVTPRAQ